MRKAERAALALVLDSVGLGYTKYQAETKLLREFLKRTQGSVARKTKAPRARRDSVFDPEKLDAAEIYLAPASIPAGLIAAGVNWTTEHSLVVTSADVVKHPRERFRPWAYTWAALAAKVKADAPAKKAKAKR